jgi:RNA polymerase sigma factor (sigma-70 family)
MTGPSKAGDSGQPATGPAVGWADQQLVSSCLDGDERAWDVLVEKYKSLVYSIAVKYGAPPDEAADLFQMVWIDVYKELDSLRKRSSLRSWLISVTRHNCYHWRQRRQREALRRSTITDLESDSRLVVAPVSLDEAERDQLVREAVFALPERCRTLIQLLFYSQPAVRYSELAQQLGLAVGSIGFVRGRCLKRLQRNLKRHGLA